MRISHLATRTPGRTGKLPRCSGQASVLGRAGRRSPHQSRKCQTLPVVVAYRNDHTYSAFTRRTTLDTFLYLPSSLRESLWLQIRNRPRNALHRSREKLYKAGLRARCNAPWLALRCAKLGPLLKRARGLKTAHRAPWTIRGLLRRHAPWPAASFRSPTAVDRSAALTFQLWRGLILTQRSAPTGSIVVRSELGPENR